MCFQFGAEGCADDYVPVPARSLCGLSPQKRKDVFMVNNEYNLTTQVRFFIPLESHASEFRKLPHVKHKGTRIVKKP